MTEMFKKKVMEMDKELKKKQDEIHEISVAKFVLEKEKKNWIELREKMKERIIKLKTRRGKVELAQKVCKNCNKEYTEKENFNWSCRIHVGDYSGEIWWCCGKEREDEPGCKYAKHESKEDEENDVDGDNLIVKTVKNIRCLCCKEKGHLIEQCPRDPNLRSQFTPEEDF